MRTTLRVGIVLSVTVLLAACGSREEREAQERAVSELERTLARSAPASVTAHHDGARLWKTIRKFYADRSHLPAWINGTRPTAQLDSLLRAIAGAPRHGLDPELYDLTLLTQARSRLEERFMAPDGFRPEAVAPLDLRATAAWFSYASDLSTGVTDRPHADAMWRIRPKQIDLLPILAASLEENRVEEALDELAPQIPEYRRLMAALERTRTQGTEGTQGTPGTQGTKGTKGTQIISLNLERWRWYPRDLGARHIRVNVPEYHLEVKEGDRTALDMKVIVGAKDNPTPIFSDTMTTIVFSPYWNVPAGIASEETLPAVLSDPEFLERNNIEVVGTSGEVVDPASIDWSLWMETAVFQSEEDGGEMDGAEEALSFPYRFRQRPGTSNSLGLVKFLFPNAFDVYLHDTPADALFKRPYRALSHGCVRLEEPVRLAEYLLRDRPDWDTPKIRKAMHSGTESHVKLAEPLPVHLMYWTAVADDSGGARFFSDLYGYDARQWRAYQARIERVKQKKRALPAEGWLRDASEPAASSKSARRGAGAASPRRAAPREGTASR